MEGHDHQRPKGKRHTEEDGVSYLVIFFSFCTNVQTFHPNGTCHNTFSLLLPFYWDTKYMHAYVHMLINTTDIYIKKKLPIIIHTSKYIYKYSKIKRGILAPLHMRNLTKICEKISFECFSKVTNIKGFVFKKHTFCLLQVICFYIHRKFFWNN